MSKLLLFICLSIFSCSLLAADIPATTPPAPKQCKFTITSTQKVAAVTAVGPIFKIFHAYDSINSTQTTAAKPMLDLDYFDNSIQHVNYTGTDCNVKYEFWSGQNFTGSYLYYTTKGKKSGSVTLNNYMSRAVSSYRFSYL